MDDYIHEGLALIQEALKDYLPPRIRSRMTSRRCCLLTSHYAQGPAEVLFLCAL